MSYFTSAGGQSASVTTTPPINTPTIANPTAAAAATEYSYTFPAGTKFFRLRTRDGARLQLSYTALQTGTVFLTVWPGETYESPVFNAGVAALYFQSYKAGSILEIESWV